MIIDSARVGIAYLLYCRKNVILHNMASCAMILMSEIEILWVYTSSMNLGNYTSIQWRIGNAQLFLIDQNTVKKPVQTEYMKCHMNRFTFFRKNRFIRIIFYTNPWFFFRSIYIFDSICRHNRPLVTSPASLGRLTRTETCGSWPRKLVSSIRYPQQWRSIRLKTATFTAVQSVWRISAASHGPKSATDPFSRYGSRFRVKFNWKCYKIWSNALTKR